MTAITLPEIAAMQTVAEAVATLSPSERKRVAAWLTAYAADSEAAAPAVEVADEATEEIAEPAVEEDAAVEEPAGTDEEPARLATLDELLAAVAPKTGAQKAAVAAYWLQVAEGRQSWKASEINKLLKASGIKVSSISIVLANAVQAKNPLVEELGRLGEGERSRKTFALTDAGVAYVESRLA